jgi:hypothetical protein
MESEYRQSFRSTSLVSISLTDIWTYMIFLLPCSEVLTVSTEGGLKRSGGQGDILSGTLSTFLAWAKIFKNGEATHAGAPEASTIESKRLLLLAAYGASTTTRLWGSIGGEVRLLPLLRGVDKGLGRAVIDVD